MNLACVGGHHNSAHIFFWGQTQINRNSIEKLQTKKKTNKDKQAPMRNKIQEFIIIDGT